MAQASQRPQDERSKVVMDRFVKPLSGKFAKVPGDDEKAYFNMLCRQLSDFDDAVLEDGAIKIARDVRGRCWPDYAVAIEACRTVAAHRSARRNAASDKRYSLPHDAALRIMLADGQQLALDACSAGWITGLYDFVRDKHRFPNDLEVENIIVAFHAREKRVATQRLAALKVLCGERQDSDHELPDRHPVQVMINAFAQRRLDLANAIYQSVYGYDLATLAAEQEGQAHANG